MVVEVMDMLRWLDMFCHMSEKYGTYNVRLITAVSFVRDSSNSGSREPKRRRLHGDRLALFDFDAKEVERFVLNK